MVKYTVTYEDTHVSGQVYDNVQIPACVDNGTLFIGHHKESEMYLNYIQYPDNFDASKLEHWADNYYLYDKKEVWQLINIVSGSRYATEVLCSYFRKASWDTSLCECKDCGKKYAISSDEASWFMGRDLTLPTRCKPCRKNRK